MLDIKPRTLHGWVRAGRLPAVKIGSQWRVKLRDIQAMVDDVAGWQQRDNTMIVATMDTIYLDIFAQEQTLQSEKLHEARGGLRKIIRYYRTGISIDQMFLEEDRQLRFNDGRYWMTEKAFWELCIAAGATGEEIAR